MLLNLVLTSIFILVLVTHVHTTLVLIFILVLVTHVHTTNIQCMQTLSL
jgi:hypothetical protein